MFTASLNPESLKAMISATDPVCGMEIEAAKAAASSKHNSKTYYFCAVACQEKFDAKPAKYLSKS
jgi:Cu+-exporting ATPase